MSKVIIEMSMSLDGVVAGPDDGKEFPNGRDGIKHVFGWLSRAKEEGGANLYEIGAAWNGFVKQFTGPLARLKAFWMRSGRTPIRTRAPVG